MTAMLAALLLASTLAPPATPAGASVAGRVHDQDGKPLAGAGVSLTRIAPAFDLKLINADGSGAFAFENVEPGVYLLSVSVAGYLPTREFSPKVVVRSSGERKQLDVRLVRPGALVGTVSGADGLPVENAAVQAVTDPAVPWTGPGAQRGTGGITEQDGQFRIPNLYPGRYYVRALPASARTGESGLPTDVRPVVLPEPVVIAPGAETRVALQVRPPPVHRLCGRVVDAKTGAPLTAGMINATHQGRLTRPGAYSEIAADGSFCMQGLPSGTYSIRVFARTLGLSEPFPIDFELGDQDAAGVVFKVGRALALRGRIVAAGGVWPTGLVVHLRGPTSPSTVSPAPDGRFEVSNVYPGTYELGVWAGPLVPALTSARLGARDVIESGIQVSPEDTALPELVIHLDARMTSIAGRVLDDAGRPVAATMVALLGPRPPGGRREPGIRTATTGLDGGYSIDGLAAGEYFLLAWPGGILELRDPSVFARLEAEVTRVRLEPQQPLRRDLRLSAAIEAVAASVTRP